MWEFSLTDTVLNGYMPFEVTLAYKASNFTATRELISNLADNIDDIAIRDHCIVNVDDGVGHG